MLCRYKDFEISMGPDEKVIDIVVSKLKELKCVNPRLKRYTTEIGGYEVTRYYIKNSINADNFGKLIDFLDELAKTMKTVISIHY